MGRHGRVERLQKTFIVIMGLSTHRLELAHKYFLTIIVYAMGGIPLFYITKDFKVVLFIYLFIIFLFKKLRIDKQLIALFLFLTIVFSFQTLIFGAGTFINYFLILLIFINPYLLYKIIGKDVFKYFVNVTYFFAFISFAFYIASNLSPTFYHFTSTLPFILNTDPTELPTDKFVDPTYFKQSFILYTFEHAKVYGNILRCPGQFWEPGVYGTYLILALIFNVMLTGSYFNKKAIVFIIAIVITFSTAAYLALFIYFISFSLTTRSGPSAIFSLVVFIPSIIYLYNTQDFLSGKVESTFDQNNVYKAADENRFISALYGLNTIYYNPLFGRGLIKDTAPTLAEGQSTAYGFVGMVGRLGIPLALFWFFSFWKGLININRYIFQRANILMFAMLLSVLFGQSVYFAPIFVIIFYNSKAYASTS